jgi:hypothetical protein
MRSHPCFCTDYRCSQWDAKSCKSWKIIGDVNCPMGLYFVIAFKKSLIAAISISFVSGRGGVTDVSGNQATVSVTRGVDESVTWTLCER